MVVPHIRSIAEHAKDVAGKVFQSLEHLAFIEARRSDEEQADALKHLTIYAWNLYTDRLDRKFVWGFTVCDSNFRACLYSQDNVFVSDAMDVTTAEGRMQLISLLVNMSFCDAGQLGYDTTISYNPAVCEWEIDVYDDERNTTDIYWVDMVAKADRGESNCICVKDSWTSCKYLTSDRDRDEVYALRRITKELGSNTELEGSFPKILSGGVVRQQRTPGSNSSPETTDTLLAALGDDVLRGHMVTFDRT
ncbi:hypothetical protein LPJ53_002081 [Coemansia erecta]|uniref:Fungal-type protein kinase domain-containing protein n=1 Tax=Coemansia erecta TaxID=147472 RepID=A0A9W8CTE6_9FUNG|nr:hypothetical protein LPJ53_002081 [Coemansia erecta]